jgi:hypothetical protein
VCGALFVGGFAGMARHSKDGFIKSREALLQ